MSTVVPASPAAATLSPLDRVLGVFVSPGKTFEDIARAPGFLLCWIIQALVALGFGLEVLHRMGAATIVRQGLLSKPSGRNMDPAALDNAVRVASRYVAWGFYTAPVTTLLLLLLLALILQGVANFFLGQEAKYKAVLAVASHAYLTQTLFALVTMGLLALAADPTTIQLTNPLGTNLGFFLDPIQTPPFLYSLASHIDAFALWTVALLALGLSRLQRKTSFGAALGAVGGMWVIWLLIQAGLFAL